ncbi:MAG: DHHW family protein [Bacillota bacterium]
MFFRKSFQIGLFIFFIGGLGIANVLTEDRIFSEHENRYLTQMPELSFHSFISGKFTNDFEKYVSDQFAWKRFWTGIKAESQKATGKQENNGIYFGKEAYLLEEFARPGDQLLLNMNHLRYFAEKVKRQNINTYFLLAPTSVEVYKNYMPYLAPSFSQADLLQIIKEESTASLDVVDVYEVLNHNKQEPLYFRTDHHWTMRGAYYAYREAANRLGMKAYDIDDFEIRTVSASFLGTFHSKAGLFNITPDKIEVFEPKFDAAYILEYDEGEKSTNSLYEWDHLNNKDQYALFLDGNHRSLKITSSFKNGRKLAVIKDSYAHVLVPFLANHFEEIHVIDLRYYHHNIYDYLDTEGIQDILFLYNAANFSTDNNLIWLKH